MVLEFYLLNKISNKNALNKNGLRSILIELYKNNSEELELTYLGKKNEIITVVPDKYSEHLWGNITRWYAKNKCSSYYTITDKDTIELYQKYTCINKFKKQQIVDIIIDEINKWSDENEN